MAAPVPPASQAFSIDVDSLPPSSGIAVAAPSGPAQDAVKAKPTPRKDPTGKTLDPGSPSLRGIAAQQASSRRSSNAHGTSPPATHAALANALGRSSPRHLSPATSQIFERDVQEPTAPEASPAIPSHVRTEDYIPPVLEASSHAITENLDPDEVEIIQHAAHHPVVAQHSNLADHPLRKPSQQDLTASQTLPGGLTSDSFHAAGAPGVPGAFPGSPGAGSPANADALSTSTGDNEAASTYGALNTQDPRRLSFISFADVVNAEHAEAASQSDAGGPTSPLAAAPSLLSAAAVAPGNRSPSPPARSPLAPASPARPAHMAGGEASPVRGGAGGSFASASATAPHTDIVVESMRATLQKTGSNDVAGGSQPLSATSAEDLSAPAVSRAL